MTTGPSTWSVSAALRFEECPLGFKLQYVDRVPRPQREIPLHWRLGTVVHYALEQSWKERKRTHGSGPMWTDEMWDLAKRSIAVAWAKEEMPEPLASDGLWDRAHLAVETTLKDQFTPWEDIVAVEHKFFVRAGMNIIGFADLLLRPSPTTLLIRDWKVRQQASKPEELQGNFQLLLYGAMAKRTMPWVTEVQASHYNPPTGHETVVTLRDRDIDAAIPRMQAVRDMAAVSDFAPEKGSWCEGCAYKPQCPAWKATGRAAVAEENMALF